MADDPNKQVTDQIRKMEIAKAVEEMKKAEEEKKRLELESEQRMEAKIMEILKKQSETKPPENNEPPKPPEEPPKPSVVERNPWESVQSKKVTIKKTLLNPFDGVYTSIDPQTSGDVEFEFDGSFNDEQQKLFKEQYTKAGSEGKAMTIPDGVKAYRTEQQEEQLE